MLVRKAVVAQLNDVTDRLHEGSPEPANWRAFGVAAELAEVVASISWDHGLHRSAQRYYVLSVQLAKLAHDDVHAATVLAALTRQCYDLGRPREGLEIVELAQYGSRKTATALLRSMLATREAWGYALLGESQAFTRAVGLAEEYFSEGASDSDHRRVRNFDAAELTGVIGGRYRELARREPRWARKAQDHIEKALELRHPSEHRLHTFDLIGLARTQLISADPERACEVVHQAISLGRPWVNGRVGAKLRDFHQEASRYAEIPVVRDTRDLIRELTSANGWMRGYALPRIGITGHMDLSRDSVSLVAGALRDVLRGRSEGELVGISCLARGSDQIFARVVLECGGFLEIVLPAADYRERKVAPDNLVEFDDFISRARVVRTLPCEESNRDAHMAASEEVLGSIDSLVAVWDGNPAGGYSGTADVVAAARERGIPVTVVWPDGARRT